MGAAVSPSSDFVPPAKRTRGLHLRTYRVDADGKPYDVTPVVEVKPSEGPPVLALGSWPECTCPNCTPSA